MNDKIQIEIMMVSKETTIKNIIITEIKIKIMILEMIMIINIISINKEIIINNKTQVMNLIRI